MSPAALVGQCRVCGRNDWLRVLSYGPMPLANAYLDQGVPAAAEQRYPLNMVACQDCWLVSLDHVVDPQVLYRNYLYVSSDSQLMTAHMGQVAAGLVRQFGVAPGSLVVEIGSNVGTQLRFFRDLGMRVLGIDPARNLARTANASGVPTIPEFFSAGLAAEIAGRDGPASLILGRHVFAHIDDLAEVLAAVTALLRPDGAFVVEVPYLLNMLAGNQFDTVYHEHLSYFSVGTLARLFARHGMRILEVERLPVHGGSILVAAGPDSGTRPAGRSVRELLELEEAEGLTGPDRYRRFAGETQAIRDAIAGLVRGLAEDGKVIAGYGAPAKGTTLLNFCNLGASEIAYCSDTTPLKQGKVLPWTHIPIFPPSYARQHPPDYYLLLAWNYAEEILRKERDYLASGGRMIVPLPTPAVV
jgi:SAM-dependent methyltransferase